MSDERHAGRPISPNRSAAIVCGDMTYAGKRCKKCGETERYTRGGACVACQRRHSIDARAALRREEEDRIEIATDCYCGGGSTYGHAFGCPEAQQPVNDGFDSGSDEA